MKKVLLLAFVIVLGFAFVSIADDDLATAAKKEKARREEIAKKKKETKTYTNEDIKNLKSSLGMESASDETQDTSGTAAESAEDTSGPDTSAIDQQIKQLQDERDEQQKKADEARDAINAGGIYHTYNVNQQYETERVALQRVKELDKQIADLNAQKQKAPEAAPKDKGKPEAPSSTEQSTEEPPQDQTPQ